MINQKTNKNTKLHTHWTQGTRITPLKNSLKKTPKKLEQHYPKSINKNNNNINNNTSSNNSNSNNNNEIIMIIIANK